MYRRAKETDKSGRSENCNIKRKKKENPLETAMVDSRD